MRITLIRHTKTIIPEGICYGASDVLPDETFVEDADKVKQQIVGLTPDKIVSSPLLRCRILAEHCGFNDIEFDDRLKELNFGNWELKPWDSIKGAYADKWFGDYINTPTPNGESMFEMNRRVYNFLSELSHTKAEHVVCFAHAGTIRCIHAILHGIKLNKIFNFKVEYGGVYEYNPDNIRFLDQCAAPKKNENLRR